MAKGTLHCRAVENVSLRVPCASVAQHTTDVETRGLPIDCVGMITCSQVGLLDMSNILATSCCCVDKQLYTTTPTASHISFQLKLPGHMPDVNQVY